MKATIKDITEEVNLIYEIYKNIYCDEEKLIKEINEKKIMIYDSLYEIILEMDSTLGVYSFIKPKKVFYWGLNEKERNVLKQICNRANCENYFVVFCDAVKKYFDIFLENNLKYNEMKYPNDFSDIKDCMDYLSDKIISGHINSKYFYDTASRVNNNKNDNRKPSVCVVVWNMLTGSIGILKHWLNSHKNNPVQFFELTQEEQDDLYCSCVAANKLGIELYSKHDKYYTVNNIDGYMPALLEIVTGVYKQYFEILLDDNIKCRDNCYKQMNMLDEFAEIHDMSERDIIDFVKKADSNGYNIMDCKTNEEIETLYKEIFPES